MPIVAAPALCGTALASYRGVEARSNGQYQRSLESCSDYESFGYQYQCVEYVRRFYAQALGVDTSKWRGNAVTYYANAHNFGLTAFSNDDSTGPAPDDIVVFRKGESAGHVAIVTAVTADSVAVIEQNWSDSGVATLQLLQHDGKYSILPRGSYQILGWLRKPISQIVVQPGPGQGKDIWTTSVYSYAPGGGGPGGGLDDFELVAGGWFDIYYSLLQFDLSTLPTTARSVRLELFSFPQRGDGTTGLYLDRITEFWDWRTQGTGSDLLRLWWADRPNFQQWVPQALPAPTEGQWYSIDITSLYNAWQNGTYPNFGIQLRPVSNFNTWAEFYSSDYLGDPSLRPKLVIDP